MGERLKEASCINLSLTTLNHVIMSICRGQRAPPFRDSALTRLLQVCLACPAEMTLMWYDAVWAQQTNLLPLQVALFMHTGVAAWCNAGLAGRQRQDGHDRKHQPGAGFCS